MIRLSGRGGGEEKAKRKGNSPLLPLCSQSVSFWPFQPKPVHRLGCLRLYAQYSSLYPVRNPKDFRAPEFLPEKYRGPRFLTIGKTSGKKTNQLKE